MIWRDAGYRDSGVSDHGLAVSELRSDSDRTFQGTVQITPHPERAIVLERTHRFRVDILNKRLRHYTKLDIAINAAERQIVDVAAERRDVTALSRIQFNRKHVVAAEVEVRRDFERERSVSAFVFGKLVAVHRHGRGGHRASEINKTPLAFPAGQRLERPPVDGYELECLFVETVPRQAA